MRILEVSAFFDTPCMAITLSLSNLLHLVADKRWRTKEKCGYFCEGKIAFEKVVQWSFGKSAVRPFEFLFLFSSVNDREIKSANMQ